MTWKLQGQTLVNTVGNVCYLAAQWLFTVLTTRSLGYEAVGILTLAMSVGNVFTFIQFYGVRTFQSSDIARQYTSGDYLTARLATMAIGLLLCLGFILGSRYNQTVRLSILLFVLFRTFEAFSDVFFGDFQREGRLELVGFSMLARGILTVLLFAAALKRFHDLNRALFTIVMVSLAFTMLVDSALYHKIVPWKAGTAAGMKGILKDCFPLLLAALLPTVITAFPRIVLERYCGAEQLGYYGNISTPAVIITAIVPNILASIMPLYGEMVLRKDVAGVRGMWGKTILGTVLILGTCLLGVLLLGKPVLAWIYTDAILPYVHYLYTLLVATALYAMTMCGTSVLVAMRKNMVVSACAVAATAVCLAIAVPLVRSRGIPGAIEVLMISYSFQNVLQVVAISRSQ